MCEVVFLLYIRWPFSSDYIIVRYKFNYFGFHATMPIQYCAVHNICSVLNKLTLLK